MNVLIADDDRTSRVLLAAVVAKWGYEPVVVTDGGAAWNMLRQPDPPRLVLLDWNMPVLDGLQICRRLRASASSNPTYVILLTGRAAKGDIVRGLAAGANDYVAKPYHSEELQARLQVGRRTLELQAHLLSVQAELAHLAMRDSLTGMLNRRAILDRLAEELERTRRQDSSLTVGMCDLDHFKVVNDTFGHQAGDEILRGFTTAVQEQLRSYDSIGRYGGEEFLLVTPGVTNGGGVGVFERVCARVAGAAMPTEKGAIPVTVSIGVASSRPWSTVDSLLATADGALYKAKADGRNRVVYASASPATPRDGGVIRSWPALQGHVVAMGAGR
jgi:two-component system, cell cycle response regulator